MFIVLGNLSGIAEQHLEIGRLYAELARLTPHYASVPHIPELPRGRRSRTMLHDPTPRPSTGRLVLCVLAGVALSEILGINF